MPALGNRTADGIFILWCLAHTRNEFSDVVFFLSLKKIKKVLNSAKGVRQSGLLIHSFGIDKISICQLDFDCKNRFLVVKRVQEEKEFSRVALFYTHARSKHSKIIVGEETVSSRVTLLLSFIKSQYEIVAFLFAVSVTVSEISWPKLQFSMWFRLYICCCVG